MSAILDDSEIDGKIRCASEGNEDAGNVSIFDRDTREKGA